MTDQTDESSTLNIEEAYARIKEMCEQHEKFTIRHPHGGIASRMSFYEIDEDEGDGQKRVAETRFAHRLMEKFKEQYGDIPINIHEQEKVLNITMVYKS